MVQSFKFTFKVLKNMKGFLSSMVIMPIVMIILVSLTLAYSDVPVVGYIGEKAPNISNVKMKRISTENRDYFLGASEGTLVIKTDNRGNVEKYYTSIKNNPLISLIENNEKGDASFKEKPKLSYSVGIILFKLLNAGSLLATMLINEKNNGIILRIKNSKIKPLSYILGKCLAIIFVYEIATVFMILFYKYAGFDLGNTTSLQILLVFNVAILISMGLYLFLSGSLKNEGYIWTLSTGIIFPLSLFSGILFPVDSMAHWMKMVAKISPLYYLSHSLISGKIAAIPILITIIISVILGAIGIKILAKRE